jgi:hypothetical protein
LGFNLIGVMSQRGFALDAGGENTFSTVPRSSPSTATMRTSPSALLF